MVGEDGKVLGMDGGNGYNSVNVLNATELHTYEKGGNDTLYVTYIIAIKYRIARKN